MGKEEKSLEVRLTSIESKLHELMKVLGPGTQETKASKADIDAYLNVLRAGLAADWGENCGINECYKCIVVCRQCTVCKVCALCSQCKVCEMCVRCDVCFECSCGPCAICYEGSMKRGLKEFQSLG